MFHCNSKNDTKEEQRTGDGEKAYRRERDREDAANFSVFRRERDGRQSISKSNLIIDGQNCLSIFVKILKYGFLAPISLNGAVLAP